MRTDPETDQTADIAERSSSDEAAALALEEAGGPSPEEGGVVVASDDASVGSADALTVGGGLGDGQVDEAPGEEDMDAAREEAATSAGEQDGALPSDVIQAEATPSGNGAAELEVEEDRPDASPFQGPGEWYVLHTYAGYENKVKANLHSRIGSMQMEDKIFDVVIPMEDVMEIKGGKKQVVQKKIFPGYLLVKMIYDNDSWYVVRNTPGVTGFVSSGTGSKPTPLSPREVEKILAVKQETQVKPQYRLEWSEGDVVRIITGPFADFTGTIAEINVEQSKLKILVNIFDRETPVEMAFDQVAKA